MKTIILGLLLTLIIIYISALVFIRIKYSWIPKTKASFYGRVGFIGFWLGSIGKKMVLWAQKKVMGMLHV